MNPSIVLLITCCSCKHNLHASSHEFIAHSPSVHLPSHIHSVLVTLTGLEVPSISGPGCLISDTRSFHQLRHVTDWCFFFSFFLTFPGEWQSDNPWEWWWFLPARAVWAISGGDGDGLKWLDNLQWHKKRALLDRNNHGENTSDNLIMHEAAVKGELESTS